MEKNKRFFLLESILIIAFSVQIFASGTKDISENSSVKSITAGVLSGPSGIPMAKMMEDTDSVSEVPVSYECYASAQQLLPKLVKGEIQIGVLPPNVAAKVYNANKGAVQAVAICGNGMLSLITTDNSIKSINDIKGKTITVAGQGATPEYMFRFILDANKISVSTEQEPDSVSLDFSIPNANIVPSLIGEKISCAVVPEPFTTVAKTKLGNKVTVINLQELFAAAEGGNKNYPMSLIVVNANFAKNNPKLIKAYLSEYKKAFDWTLKNPKEAGSLCEKHELGLTASVVEKAIPNANFSYLPASSTEARKQIEALLCVFQKFDETSIGGKLPDDYFYIK